MESLMIQCTNTLRNLSPFVDCFFFPLILGQGILRELQTVGSRTTTLSHSLMSIEAFQRMCILKCDLVLERLQMEISLNCSLM